MDDTQNIFFYIDQWFDKIRENQKLQEFAEKNGIEIKNTLKYTDDTIQNILVSSLSLLLAKRSDDARYRSLVNQGIQKRALKTEIINAYKNEALKIIDEYYNREKYAQPAEE